MTCRSSHRRLSAPWSATPAAPRSSTTASRRPIDGNHHRSWPTTCERYRVALAVVLDRTDDLPPLLDALAAYRGFETVGSGGSLVDAGPVELHLGTGAGALEQWDDAIAELTAARDRAATAGARGFAVEASVELAAALQHRGKGDDPTRATRLLSTARPEASALGMRPWVDRIDRELGAPAAQHAPLSPREAEVAALVADGLTNRQIAERLYLSERTAQNHVQHILTKLGYARRAQIAAWHAERLRP